MRIALSLDKLQNNIDCVIAILFYFTSLSAWLVLFVAIRKSNLLVALPNLEEMFMWNINKRYEIDDEPLRTGGIGVVYKGRDTVENCDIVVKFPKESENFERFRRREGVVTRLDHPNIVKVYRLLEIESGSCTGGVPSEIKKSGRIPCIVMESVDGCSLDKLIDDKVPPGKETVHKLLNIFKQILDAVVYLHEQRVVNSDLNPSNIMVTEQGNIKIIDFDLAIISKNHDITQSTGLDRLCYTSPEQVCTPIITDERADIYSLGALLYKLLTGNNLDPYWWRDSEKLSAPLVRDSNPNVSPGLFDLIARCLKKELSERFKSVKDFQDSFNGCEPFIKPGFEPPKPSSDLKVGDRFSFGRYPQGPNGEVLPITWRVLESDSLLVISDEGLDVKPYNENLVDITWSECTLRRWLNGEFFEQAFSEQEKTFIKMSNLSNNADPTTSDRIFLLSIEEVRRLFTDVRDRMAKLTEYAVKNGADVYAGNTDWWLRSCGANGQYANFVYDYGAISDQGRRVTYEKCSIRPVLRLAKSFITKVAESYTNAQVGERFNFGRYPQGANGEVEPITWRVLKRSPKSLLVISEKGLDAKPYNEKFVDTTWSECTLRHWLNGEFLEQAFSKQEKSLIKMSNLSNNAGSYTSDRISLLSVDEALRFFAHDKDREVKNTAYAINKGTYTYDDGTGWWWLRSRGDDVHGAAYVDINGNIDSDGYSVICVLGSVRPALRLTV